MFVDAYRLASEFTKPVIISTLNFDGSVECGCGAFILLNEEGWIVTVEHIFRSYFLYQQHSIEFSEYNKKVKEIQDNNSYDFKRKRKKIDSLKTNPKWIINHSFWWGKDGVVLKDIKALPEGDLLIGRLEPFQTQPNAVYPVIKNKITDYISGKSLCKLGFPFHKIEANYDKVRNAFNLAEGALPLPFFPIEGISTRSLLAGKSGDGKFDIIYLETSSPGLMGQSGGPIFDEKGTIWAIQSKTAHYPLGFSPQVERNGRTIEENQFLNVGIGVHHNLIIDYLRDNDIKFNVSDQ